MLIDKRCKLCLINNRVNDLIKLNNDEKIPLILESISKILNSNLSRDEMFSISFEEIIKLTNKESPYKEMKLFLNDLGRKIAKVIEENLVKNSWDYKLAMEFSAAANIIDTHVLGFEPLDLKEAIWEKPLIYDDINLSKNRTIYFVADNSGEIYIDFLLVKALKAHGFEVKLVIREEPYEIDISSSDDIKFDIMTPGNYSPIKYLNDGFIISKGIANLEAYLENEVKLDSLHLFRAKCDVLAEKFKVKKNMPIIISGQRAYKILKK